jgi:hypothetical protein
MRKLELRSLTPDILSYYVSVSTANKTLNKFRIELNYYLYYIYNMSYNIILYYTITKYPMR